MKVAIIPARGESKRIPKKNIRQFMGKPVIAYAIEAARACGMFDRIIVSTDSEEIAEIARQWGAEVPFQRPAVLADDHATTAEVLVHAVGWLIENGGCEEFCCIYPATPLLQPESLAEGQRTMTAMGADAAISVSEFDHPVQRALRQTEAGRVVFISLEKSLARTQDLPELVHDAGQFYWCKARPFLAKKDIFALQPVPILLSRLLVQDIDTPEDWELAELKFLRLRRAGRAMDAAAFGSRIVHGTAQLGFTYGIANRDGRPSAAVANSMLCAAWAGGIRIFDTAQAYGDSEYVLGDFFAGSYGFSEARFITKLHPDVALDDPDDIRNHVEESLRRMSVPQLWLLLLHREEHLNHWSGVLGNTLRRLKRNGLIGNLGASVYSVEMARKAILNPDVGYLSIPAGIFDRRMQRSGIAKMAAQYNKTLLIRSVFLQGLALMDIEKVPAGIPYGRKAAEVLGKFCRERALDRREFAFGYVRSAFPNALVVLGADTTRHVEDNCKLDALPPLDPEHVVAWDERWLEDHEQLYNPAIWPQPERASFQ